MSFNFQSRLEFELQRTYILNNEFAGVSKRSQASDLRVRWKRGLVSCPRRYVVGYAHYRGCPLYHAELDCCKAQTGRSRRHGLSFFAFTTLSRKSTTNLFYFIRFILKKCRQLYFKLNSLMNKERKFAQVHGDSVKQSAEFGTEMAAANNAFLAHPYDHPDIW